MGWRWKNRRGRDAGESLDLRDIVLPPVTCVSFPGRVLPAVSSGQYQALVERRRAEAVRAEAQREVEALRQRHWSPERVFEESRLGIDWWEHPLADPHALLGVLPGDSFEDAVTARRRIAMAIHPDRVMNDGDLDRELAEHQMAAVNSGYDRLRRAYAPERSTPPNPHSTNRNALPE